MERFAGLLDQLVYTQSRNRKLGLLAAYFRAAPDHDRGWALAALTDGLPLRLPLRRALTELVGETVDPVLYRLSRDYVGDTAETVALLWPDKREAREERSTDPLPLAGRTREGGIPTADVLGSPPPNLPRKGGGILLREIGGASTAPTLDEVVTAVGGLSIAGLLPVLRGFLDRLDARGRWALLKLLGGAPRVGVSARLAKTALAQAFGHAVEDIEEVWHAADPPYLDLFRWLEGQTGRPDPGRRPVYRPVMLAHPIEEREWAGLAPEDFAAEWKWDGIRVQIAAHGGAVRLFSRTGDDASAAFPEICSAFRTLDAVADGELLVVREGEVAPFNGLQQRLNRKTVTAKMLTESPAHLRLYDLLFADGVDLRALPFVERRRQLEAWHASYEPANSDVSPLVPFETFADLDTLWAGARENGVEGLMLKRKASPYLAGRVRGHWFKWKRAPLTLDCVLMYAQRGSGKRSSFYSDYTFGVWREAESGGRELVPVGKAYSGFTDAELKQLDQWIRNHTTDRFGPVRAVSPGLVLEVAFDAVFPSTRHKSGVAMRFPRVHRIRWDKPAGEADTIEAVMRLMPVAGLGAPHLS